MKDTTAKILKLLKEQDGYLSGEDIGRRLSLSRNTVWKHVKVLKERGYEITSSTRRGYRLRRTANVPLGEEVGPHLRTGTFGRRIEFCDTVDSTNRAAVDLAREGGAEGDVIAADRQTAGRGRLGRTWHSPPGINLYFSVILTPPVEPARVPQLALVTAAALHAVIADHCPAAPVMIKWPNDILIGGKKVAGILCETRAEADRVHFAVVGVGINVNGLSMPRALRPIATSLQAACGREFSRPRLFAGVLNRLEKDYRRWLAAPDLGDFLPYLDEHSALKGKRVSVRTAAGETVGRVISMSARGELVIETPGGRELLLSGGEVTIVSKGRHELA